MQSVIGRHRGCWPQCDNWILNSINFVIASIVSIVSSTHHSLSNMFVKTKQKTSLWRSFRANRKVDSFALNKCFNVLGRSVGGNRTTLRSYGLGHISVNCNATSFERRTPLPEAYVWVCVCVWKKRQIDSFARWTNFHVAASVQQQHRQKNTKLLLLFGFDKEKRHDYCSVSILSTRHTY